jgi:sialic acid synthase SpsE
MIIAEIGFNHLGCAKAAHRYLDTLLYSDIDGITFQIREVLHQKGDAYLYFDDSHFSSLFSRIKEANKSVGIALADKGYMPLFEGLDVDFYKVIRDGIKDVELLDAMRATDKKVFVSTGMASHDDIYNFVSLIDGNKNFKLVHTQLSYSLEDCNLSSILTMKEHGVEVAYGSHCLDEVSLFMATCYNPSDLLFYVKEKRELSYPDDEHAIFLHHVDSIIQRIKKAQKGIGDGIKKQMINKIEEGEK